MTTTTTVCGLVGLFLCLAGGPRGFGQSSAATQERVQASDTTEQESKRTVFAFMIGGSRWKALHEIQPVPAEVTKYEGFPLWGYNLELSFHRSVKRSPARDLRVGVDFGAFFTPANKSFSITIYPAENRVPMTLDARGIYLTPSVQYVLGTKQKKFRPLPYFGGGAGFYGIDIVTLLGGMELDTFYEKYTMGGYVSAGMSLPLSQRSTFQPQLLVEGKVHFVRFGHFENFATTGRIGGPVWILQLGVGFGE